MRSTPMRSRRSLLLLALLLGTGLGLAAPAAAADYASAISAFRRAHGLSAVRLDNRLDEVALKQARAMAASGTVSHTVAGIFSVRVAGLRKSRAAENIGAGFLSFTEMLKQWEDSTGHRENLLMAGARRVGVASVDNPKSPYRKFWAMVITD
jgi:uncharacterized protein YkwD